METPQRQEPKCHFGLLAAHLHRLCNTARGDLEGIFTIWVFNLQYRGRAWRCCSWVIQQMSFEDFCDCANLFEETLPRRVVESIFPNWLANLVKSYVGQGLQTLEINACRHVKEGEICTKHTRQNYREKPQHVFGKKWCV